ncbi:MAG: DUF4236 domain-containing protein [Erysipelotrichaceae bacterium]|nr:DUF4236 domain-containing protein [Erysipelotrichaceae bacterium]
MGLRYRKSITIAPGVRLNIGKTGMSVSAGVPGFRKTYHTSGRVTTTVGVPGTGLYYVDTKNNKTQNKQSKSNHSNYETTNDIHNKNIIQLDQSTVKSIHKTCDDSIDWTEVLVSSEPPDDSYNKEMWQYYHNFAPKILQGDINAYLQLIYEVNPLDDLLAYGGQFEFGTDDAKKIEVEFVVDDSTLTNAKRSLSTKEYNNLLQDYVCSVCIRIARDMFALLPVNNAVIHAVLNGNLILSVNFDRYTITKIKFGYIDSSDTIEKFPNNMNYSDNFGFRKVEYLN